VDRETSEFRKSRFRIQETSEFRKIQNWETGFQNRETGILKIGNWTGKLQNSESQDSEFRKLQNSEKFRIQETSEFRIGKLDFRIGKLEFFKSETGPGNFRIQKLQNSGN